MNMRLKKTVGVFPLVIDVECCVAGDVVSMMCVVVSPTLLLCLRLARAQFEMIAF